jgi:hypothetical protein
MSLALLRRATSKHFRQLQLSRLTNGLAHCMQPADDVGGSGGSLALPATTAARLWRYDSPLLRHLNTAAMQNVSAEGATCSWVCYY